MRFNNNTANTESAHILLVIIDQEIRVPGVRSGGYGLENVQSLFFYQIFLVSGNSPVTVEGLTCVLLLEDHLGG